ncbi:MAG: hypothetical protein LBR10_09405 [Prevotellaceae bacterium]|jgi:hypothetical protein|nr:hypothetical protein [Prevotellaceae bacterium]
MPWSKLQREIYDLISSDINFQIHCVAYPMRSRTSRGSTDIPRYWITLGKEIIWDYPKDFLAKAGSTEDCSGKVHPYYPFTTDIHDISDLIREYIDTPQKALFDKNFEKDKWGLTDILKAADRRIGVRRLSRLKSKTQNIAAGKVIDERMLSNRNKAAQTSPANPKVLDTTTDI